MKVTDVSIVNYGVRVVKMEAVMKMIGVGRKDRQSGKTSCQPKLFVASRNCRGISLASSASKTCVALFFCAYVAHDEC